VGQAISYCYKCSQQLRDADFQKGKAFRIDAMVCCAACVPEAFRALAHEKTKEAKKGVSSIRTPRPRSSASQTAIPTVAPAPRRRLILGGAILGGAALAILVLLFLPGGERKPPPAPAPPPTPVVGPAKTPAPVPKTVHAGLEQARQYARSHPDDLEGQIRRFEELAFQGDQTEAGAEARKEVEALRRREREAVERELASLEQEIAGPLAVQGFGDALRRLEAARHRQRSSQWKLAVEKRARDIDDLIKAQFNPLKARALDAKAKGATADVEAALRQVRKWEVDDYTTALTAALAAVAAPPPPPPPPPPTSAEAKAYRTTWEKAMQAAAARDHAGAAAALAAATLTEAPLREERAQDVRDLQELAKLYGELLQALAASKEPFLSLRGPAGRVMSIDADRVELLVDPRKPTQFVEWSDLPLSFLAALAKTELPPGPAALARALDGDGDLRGWTRAEIAVPPEERRARELYYEAERGYRAMATRGTALEVYARLLRELKDTTLVRRARERLERRADGGREYAFAPADLTIAGAVAPGKDGRLATSADDEGSWIEWEFYARPSTAYRCWVLAGACCAEALDLHYQATGHQETDPKTKKRAPAEPGGGLASPVKASIRGLKSAHPAKEPKAPSKWDWIEIPLPKAAEGGARRVRLLASKAGFGAAAVVVSAVLKKAPTEEEHKELAARHAAEGPSDRSTVPVVLLDDFEQDPMTWGYVGGTEFGPSKGGLVVDAAQALGGKRSARLNGDFSAGGSYVGGWRTYAPPKGWDVREIRFWLKADGVTGIGVRLADGSDQCHQKNGGWPLKATTDWQEVVIPVAQCVGGEHWGGAKDGVWHGPMRGFGFNIGKNGLSDGTRGTIWLDDLRVVLEPAP
jgi:hypothetical protein